MMRESKLSSFILDKDGIQRHVMIPHYQAINDVPLPCSRNKLGVIVSLMRCFNCGSSRHRVSDCKIERNNLCILMNKTWMQDYVRLGVKKDREDEEYRHTTRYFTSNEPNSKGDPSLAKYVEPPELQLITEESQPDIYEYVHVPPPQPSIYLTERRDLTLPPLQFQCPSLTPPQRKHPRKPRTGKPHIAQRPRSNNSHKAGRARRPQYQETKDRRERLAAASKILRGKYEKSNASKHRHRHQKKKPKGTARRSQSQQKQDPRESRAAASKVLKGKNEKRSPRKQRHRHQKNKPQSTD